METTYPFELTLGESYYLSDSMSEFRPSMPNADNMQWLYPDFLLKIGSAVLETTASPNKPVIVEFTKDELRVIREVAKSSIMLGAEKVGLNLLVKTYTGLLKMENETYTDFDDADGHEQVDKATISRKAAEFKSKIKAEEEEKQRQMESEQEATPFSHVEATG